jgi:transposase
MLTDETWNVLSRIMHLSGRIYNKPEHRKTLEGILFKMRTGIPWRDLPPYFGNWSAVFRRFNLWSKKDVLNELFRVLTRYADTDWLFIDGSIVRAHQHSTGAATADDESIGKSRGGNSTKIHLAVDSGGLPVYYELSCGNTHDIVHGESLVANSPASKIVVADKGYSSEKLRVYIRENDATPVIPRKVNSLVGNDDIDWCMYKYRHLVENAFGRIKQYRGIATRYEKLERNYHSMVALAFAMMWLPMWAD